MKKTKKATQKEKIRVELTAAYGNSAAKAWVDISAGAPCPALNHMVMYQVEKLARRVYNQLMETA